MSSSIVDANCTLKNIYIFGLYSRKGGPPHTQTQVDENQVGLIWRVLLRQVSIMDTGLQVWCVCVCVRAGVYVLMIVILMWQGRRSIFRIGGGKSVSMLKIMVL